jgi:hypothetical protein
MLSIRNCTDAIRNSWSGVSWIIELVSSVWCQQVFQQSPLLDNHPVHQSKSVAQFGASALGNLKRVALAACPPAERVFASLQPAQRSEVGAFYWTVPAPDIVNSGREEQGSVSV